MGDVAAYSKLDSDRFGKRIHRADVHDLEHVALLDEFAEAHTVDMVVTRCPVEALSVAQGLESAGHRIMDTLVFYQGPAQAFETATWPHSIRPATDGDREALRSLAADAFRSYRGHYHSDPKLDPELATLGYVEWCLSCLDAEDHSVWVSTEGHDVSGFIAVRREGLAADIRLNGVASRFQRQGIYDSLVKASGQSLFRQGIRDVSVSTQIHNFAPQKVWMRNGMSIRSAVYTFHKWYAR